MNVAHDGDRGSDMHHIALFHEKLLGLCTNGLDDRLGQQLLVRQARDTLVEVYGGCTGLVSIVGRGQAVQAQGGAYTEVRAWQRMSEQGGLDAAPAARSGNRINTGREQVSVSYNHPRRRIKTAA